MRVTKPVNSRDLEVRASTLPARAKALKLSAMSRFNNLEFGNESDEQTRSQKPAIASSTELSTTSQMRWCSPLGPVDPMYMPGRFRTASRPSNLSIWAASYFCPWLMPVASFWRF